MACQDVEGQCEPGAKPENQEKEVLIINPISSKQHDQGYGNIQIDINKVYYQYDSEKLQRLRFVRRVYTTLLIQLILTTSVCAICMYVDAVREYVIHNVVLMIVGLVLSFVMLIVLFCVKDKYPLNLYCLMIWTLIEAYTVGVICGIYVAEGYHNVVLQAFILTIGLFISLTLFTMQSKWDFSFLGVILFACLFVLIIWGIIIMIFGFQMMWLYSLFGAIIFCGFIIFDTWWIMRKADVYSEGAWILASINLYLDVINLFLFLLELLSSRK